VARLGAKRHRPLNAATASIFAERTEANNPPRFHWCEGLVMRMPEAGDGLSARFDFIVDMG
jgi:hypothetical protein